MKPGDLYRYPKCSLILFPTRETAARARSATTATAGAGAAYWSKRLDCRVTYIPDGELFMVLTSPDEKPNQYGYHQIQVLHGETVGWINWNPTWMKLEKVTEQ